MIRWEFERDGRFKVPVKVEILDSEYSGSPQVLTIVGNEPVRKIGGQRNRNILHPIFGEYLELRLRAKKGDFEDFFERDNERFRVRLYVDGNFDSEYIPITDTFSEPDTPGTYEVTLRCACLSSLKQVKAWKIFDVDEESHERMSKLDGIHKIVTHFFDLTVTDCTITYPQGASQSTSALSQIDFSTQRFEEDQSAYSALEWLIGEENQIRVQDGTAYVFPVLEASFDGYEYDGETIESTETFDSNFVSQKVGGRLSKTRSMQQAYDSVQRTYQPLQAPNLIKNGNMDTLDDFFFIEGGIGGLRVGYPASFDYLQNPTPTTIHRAQDTQNPWGWRLFIANMVRPETIFIYNPDFSVNQGQQMVFSVNLRTSASTIIAGMFELRVGDYVCVASGDVDLSNIATGEMEWVLRSSVNFPNNLFPVNTDKNSSGATIQIPPVPETGQLSMLVSYPMPFGLLPSFFNQGFSPPISISPDDYLEISDLSLDVVDEDQEIIRESVDIAGDGGEVYEYTERFGDGFTSLNPGALFFDGMPTTNWQIKGLTGTFSKGEIQTKYLFSELSRDRSRLQGTIDTFDTIALIDGKRVNYINTNWRYGRSDIELCEISEHDLEATVEERRSRGGSTFRGRPGPDPTDRFNAFLVNSIGELTEDVFDTVTELSVNLDNPVQAGLEYWVINRDELSVTDREAGLYPFLPVFTDSQGNPVSVEDSSDLPEGTVKEHGPGSVNVPIESDYIGCPEGSIIVKAPTQEEIDDNVDRERINDTDRRTTELDQNLTNLNDVVLPELDGKLEALDDNLENLNDVVLPALESNLEALEDNLENLNDTVLPALNSQLSTLDGYFDDPSTIPSNYNFFTGIVAENAFINSLVARELFTDQLAANSAFVNELVANNAFINSLVTRQLFTDQLAANEVFTDALVANNAFIEELVTRELFTDQLAANTAFVNSLVANTAFIDELISNEGFISDFYSENATILATLILGSGGEFTNSNEDFLINAAGVFIRTSSSLQPSRAITFGADQGQAESAYIYQLDVAADPELVVNSLGKLSIVGDEDVNILSLSSDILISASNDITIDTLNNLRIVGLPSSSSGLPSNTVYRNPSTGALFATF